MAKPQRFCIYCGSGHLTKEHIWAKWLLPYVPLEASSFTTHSPGIHAGTPDGVKQETGRVSFKRTGALQSLKPRVVCKTCNNVWMSQLQEQAKAVVVPMIERKEILLAGDQQRLIARWITMMSMTLQHFFPVDEEGRADMVTATQEEREYLRNNDHPPPTWRVLMGQRTGPSWQPVFSHSATPIHSLEQPAEGGWKFVYPPRAVLHITVMGVGPIYACTTSSADANLRDWRYSTPWARRRMTEIWPNRREVVEWPRTFQINLKQEIHLAAVAHFTFNRQNPFNN